ncbi:LOB domain-containing protein 33 [Vitis vinifera]|uniref:LOB domain-containing protein 33 n=1 Tax=Vitis vinifera TaxID=29760 RepID=A0A438JX98_VITVI|nr:LOB domain-containing protein 33 [Vitis vinifera]
MLVRMALSPNLSHSFVKLPFISRAVRHINAIVYALATVADSSGEPLSWSRDGWMELLEALLLYWEDKRARPDQTRPSGQISKSLKIMTGIGASCAIATPSLHNRGEAAITISYEALARMRDPVYGCVAHIFALQQQVANLQEEIEILGNHMATFAPDTVTGSATIHAGNATANQAFDSLMNEQPPPLYGWENQNFFCDSDATPLERLFEGIDQEFSAYYPWSDNTTYPKN